MCLSSTPKAPTPPPALPEAPVAPDVASSMSNMDADKRRRANAAGGNTTSTLLTGSRGLTGGANVSTKTLLGS